MKQISRIVVANDCLDGLPEALEKAAMIEHYTGAGIDVMEVVYDTIAEEPPEVLPRDQQTRLIEAMKAAERSGLRNLIEPLRKRVASIDPQVLWNKQADTAIVDALGGRHDQLLIKPVSAHSQLTDFFQTPLDWALMRQAPCPVLISKGRSWETPRHVLAAVDLSDALVLIATLDIPAVKNLRVALETLDALGTPKDNRVIVLNRSELKVGLRPEDVVSAIKVPIAVSIPSSMSVPASINRGIPIVIEDPKGAVSMAIEEMTNEHIRRRLGEDLPEAPHRKGLFSRSSR